MLKKIYISIFLLAASPLVSAQVTQEFLNTLNEMTTPDLAARAEKAQKEAFEMFNELNDNENYDVLCERVSESGSRMSVQKCEPRFVGEIKMMFRTNSQVSSAGGANFRDAEPGSVQGSYIQEAHDLAETLNFQNGLDYENTENGIMAQAYEELSNRINRLREENPEFHHAFTEYQAYTAVLNTR